MQPNGEPQIPDGVDTWFVSPGDESDKSSVLDNSGEYFPSFYFDGNGTWNNTNLEYETAFLGNRSIQWIRESATRKVPWFLYLASHAPHGASLPAPWYKDLTVPQTAPRFPSWNYSGADHHWLIAQQPPITMHEAAQFDKHFQNRWRCLRAVDDMIAALATEITALGLDNSTFVFHTSDHGYHFGEMRLGEGKWNVYDTDLKVPMRIVGPGVVAGAASPYVGSHADLAPTWLGLAGINTPDEMDGRSMVRHIVDPTSELLPESVAAHLQQNARDDPLPSNGVYIEYHGLGMTGAPGRLGDAFNNTYRALRVINHQPGGLGNVMYAEFGDFFFNNISFHEFYDMDADRWQLHNIWDQLSDTNKTMWAAKMRAILAPASR
jgi:arylsulfatase A-like enzyme